MPARVSAAAATLSKPATQPAALPKNSNPLPIAVPLICAVLSGLDQASSSLSAVSHPNTSSDGISTRTPQREAICLLLL